MSIFDRFAQKSASISQANQRKQHLTKMHNELTRNAKEDARRFPELAEEIPPLVRKVWDVLKKYQSEGDPEPVDASALAFLSKDCMTALVCLLPPMGGGREIAYEDVEEALKKSQVAFGMQDGAVVQALRERDYLHFFPAAKGTPSVDGIDGSVTVVTEAPEPREIEIPEGGTPDFSLDGFRPTRPGEVLCTVVPPSPGKAGCNVLGETLSFREPEQEVNLPTGLNILVSEDGLQVTSGATGLLFQKNGRFFVREHVLLSGPVTESFTAKKVKDVYVMGDVLDHAVITAPGNIIVTGEVRDSELHSAGGTIRVCKGVWGGTLFAAKQVQAAVLEQVQVESGGAVYVGRMVNCTVNSGGLVAAMGEDGLIAGGSILAKDQVSCVRLGGGPGQMTEVAVGYTPETMQEINEIAGKLNSVNQTVDKLRKSVIELRMAGDTLSPEKRALLSQLVEQRSLYESEAQKLSSQQKAAQEKLREARSGSVRCAELSPTVVIRIGDKTGEFKRAERSCHFHIYMGQIVVK